MTEFNRVEAVVNTASGSVSADAPERMEALFDELGLRATVHVPGPGELPDVLQKAVAAKPDLLITLAGDGTARAAAELCAMEGPILAPLPGGTMNMLPGAIYGSRKWEDALRDSLSEGETRVLGAGEVQGQVFFCAAILGSPALWAQAREAVREGKLIESLRKARFALRHAFSGRLRYSLNGRVTREKTEALALICPLISRAMPDDAPALEASALDPEGAAGVFSLAFRAMAGDWRSDPSVTVEPCRQGRAWAGGRIPAILDGEWVRLGPTAAFSFRDEAVRVLAPKEKEPA